MKDNFKKVIPYIYSEEGGYVDNPHDPGGATNMGITRSTLSAWRGSPVSAQDVMNLSKAEATRIYQQQFWNKIDGDNLPSGVDYAMFDFAVNSGPGRAAKLLQEIIDEPQDGVIGAKTIAAVSEYSSEFVINALCDARASWLKGLSTASRFGSGWFARVERVRARALDLIATPPIMEPAEPKAESLPKARQCDTSVQTVLRHPEALGTIGSALSGLVAIATGNGPVQYALAIVMLVCAGVGLWYFIKRIRNEA
ncbi:glycoside hydrolase family 108 protein [Ochrobactrum sp. Marseille-Q0166]|uniref:glycoside hydrolase family 108 protein n=1 Tax=Ochrobactrum sp. Marseille-Q0166 TaxID=2761105 RepID=UPI0016564705|nr:glycoside hydrolase family 108 protein [Ochrobactrum sp. Marseille-Q0166]MBC8717597.1 glycoside hydrolase family 108 protein [Ochrobactrum sp. Marseille-Q0166]